jgi:hypothetical protein
MEQRIDGYKFSVQNSIKCRDITSKDVCCKIYESVLSFEKLVFLEKKKLTAVSCLNRAPGSGLQWGRY